MATGRELINAALRKLNASSANSAPTAEDMDIGLEALNSLIESKSNTILNTHTITPKRYLLVPGQSTYSLGPTGDWVTDRPMRIEKAKLMLNPELVESTIFSRYAAIPCNNGYDGDVGISGYLGDTAPFEITSLVIAQTDPGFNPISAETGLKGAAWDSDNNFGYAGIGAVGDTVNFIGPAPIGTVRAAAQGGTQRPYFYVPIGATDILTVISQNFQGYGLPYTVIVNVGPTSTTGQRYQLTGSAADSGFDWAITRLADA